MAGQLHKMMGLAMLAGMAGVHGIHEDYEFTSPRRKSRKPWAALPEQTGPVVGQVKPLGKRGRRRQRGRLEANRNEA